MACTGVALAQRPQAFRERDADRTWRPSPSARLSTADPDRVPFRRSDVPLRARPALDASRPSAGFPASGARRTGARSSRSPTMRSVLKARVETSDGRLSGLSGSVLSPLILANGVPMRRTRYYDTESFALAGNAAFVGVERNHAVIRFERTATGSIVARHADRRSAGGQGSSEQWRPRSARHRAAALAPGRRARRDRRGRERASFSRGRGRALSRSPHPAAMTSPTWRSCPTAMLLLLERRFSLFGA